MLRTRLRFLLFPGLAGILGFASLPKAGQGYLAWIALISLVLFLFRARSVARAFGGGFIAGAVQYGGLLAWIPAVMRHYGELPAAAAWGTYGLLVAMQAGFHGIACALTGICMSRWGDKFLFVFPLAWVSMEYARNYFPFGGFPWLLFGYSQTDYLRLIQISDLTSVYGISFLILWVNTALAWLMLRREHNQPFIWPIVVAGTLLGGCLAYGELSLRRWGSIQPSHSAALLQGDLSLDDDERILAWKFHEGYVQMADEIGPAKVELLVLPESPSPLIYQYDERYRTSLQQLARRFALGLIFNNISYDEARGASRYFNSAYFLGPDGKELGRYDKIHLVPFGEYIPLKWLFFFAVTITKDVSDFCPGAKHLTVSLGAQAVNAIICFEAVFPQLARRFVHQGSQLIVNLTNDGWYGASAAPFQHLAMSRWRAVENRRYLLRATNSGISAIVEPTGRIQARTRLLQREVCLGRFSFIGYLSFYSRYGDVFALLCAIIVFFTFSGCLILKPADQQCITSTSSGPPDRLYGEMRDARGTARKS